METTKKLIKSFKKRWPSPIVARKAISDFTGGMYKPQTIVNLTAKGKAPKPFYIKGCAVYKVDTILDWLLADLKGEYEGYDISKKSPNSTN